MKITVKKRGRTWSVYVNDVLHEGGFFSRAAADDCARLITEQHNAAPSPFKDEEPERWDGMA